jgi:hypothetical protein
VIAEKLSPLQRIGSGIFLVCMILLALKGLGGVDLGVPKGVWLGLMVVAFVIRFVKWPKRDSSDG